MLYQIIFLTVLFILYLIILNRKSDRRIPGPFKIPLFGNGYVFLRFWLQEPFIVLEKINNKYGKVAWFATGKVNMVITKDYETIKEILCSDVWVDRPSAKWINDFKMGTQFGLILGNGDPWKEIRRFTMRTLREFGFGKKTSMEEFINEELQETMSIINKYATNPDEIKNEKELPISRFFTINILNILWGMIAGVKFSQNNPQLQSMINQIYTMSKNFPIGRNVEVAFPIVEPIMNLIDSGTQLKQEFISTFHDYFKKQLNDRRAEGNYKEEQRDFIDVFLNEIAKNENDPNSFYKDEAFIVATFDMFLAGSETSSNTLEFSILYCILNPHVQQKVQEEIDRVVGRNRNPSLLDRPNMPYTEASLLEIQRMANVIPVDIRVPTCKTSLGQFTVPKGTYGVINLYAMHMDEETWTNPKEFNPDRFLDENGKIINAHKILPFGSGKRVCMGETLAKATLFIYFSNLLQKYTFSPSENHPRPTTKPEVGFTLNPAFFYVHVKHRY